MSFGRLRTGEWLVGGGSLLLLIDLFVLPWYGLTNVFSPTASSLGQQTSATGWQGLLILGPGALIVGIVGLVLWWLQGSQRAPALPVVCTLLELPLSVLLVICLLLRVVFVHPAVLIPGAPGVNPIESLYGGYLGLALSIVIAVGAYMSLRRDGIAVADAPERVEILRLKQSGTG
jgi:hypothetical protein